MNSFQARRLLPIATYRLQLNRSFRFSDAKSIIPYLKELGISHLYLSPIMQSRPGSLHGYDICDHNRINEELGGESGFTELAESSSQNGMGIVLDIVPNHMGISNEQNQWWMDVLENGRSSIYASYFDIDWEPVKPELRDKILLPILEDQYGNVLESGKLQLAYREGSFFIHYYDFKLPVAPRTYSKILSHRLNTLAEKMPPSDPDLQELQSIITALGYLPSRTELHMEKIAERQREKEVAKRRLAELYNSNSEMRNAINDTVAEFNGVVGDPRSFDNLDELLSMQVYRTAFWKVAAEEINYRRFFDINDLAAIRMEDPEVFKATHQLILSLLADGKIAGLRIDHADGLKDPAAYLRQIQHVYLERIGRSSESLYKILSDQKSLHTELPLYTVVEKILCEGESLPQDWATCGTTGYDFLSLAGGIFVDADHVNEFTNLYSDFIGRRIDFGSMVNSAKKMIMLVSLASEIYGLSHELDRISETNRRYRDFTIDTLTFAIREVIASIAVYRTYITAPGSVSMRDRTYIEDAIADVRRRNPRTAEALFDFIRDTLLLRNIQDFPEPEREKLIQWVMKFQQISGPVMAKGVEDTAFYVFNRLLSLNEVGGSPHQFGITLQDFHKGNSERSRFWPHSMLAGTTHDTKRSEDVRARLNVLSEIPEEWQNSIAQWRSMNADGRTLIHKAVAPDPNDEYLFYQTLVGSWPAIDSEKGAPYRDRIVAYMHKAIKESKTQTSWVNPNREYDEAIRNFVLYALRDDPNPFLESFLPFQQRIAFYGKINALAQLLLKLTCPGSPDLYQGSELWDLRLVDPDNRAPVDYQIRISALNGLKNKMGPELLEETDGGSIKLFIIYRALQLRNNKPDLFYHGDYIPLELQGSMAAHVCAFRRNHESGNILVAVPRLPVSLTHGVEKMPLGEEIWHDTCIAVASGQYRNIFTGELIQASDSGIPIAEIFKTFPVALLELEI